MKINWKVRLKNKAFWMSIIPMAFTLVYQVLKLFGVEMDFTVISEQLVNIVGTVFLILGVLGVITDPTTEGVTDSDRAMTYDNPM